jgi:hypothetical protein
MALPIRFLRTGGGGSPGGVIYFDTSSAEVGDYVWCYLALVRDGGLTGSLIPLDGFTSAPVAQSTWSGGGTFVGRVPAAHPTYMQIQYTGLAAEHYRTVLLVMPWWLDIAGYYATDVGTTGGGSFDLQRAVLGYAGFPSYPFFRYLHYADRDGTGAFVALPSADEGVSTEDGYIGIAVWTGPGDATSHLLPAATADVTLTGSSYGTDDAGLVVRAGNTVRPAVRYIRWEDNLGRQRDTVIHARGTADAIQDAILALSGVDWAEWVEGDVAPGYGVANGDDAYSSVREAAHLVYKVDAVQDFAELVIPAVSASIVESDGVVLAENVSDLNDAVQANLETDTPLVVHEMLAGYVVLE